MDEQYLVQGYHGASSSPKYQNAGSVDVYGTNVQRAYVYYSGTPTGTGPYGNGPCTLPTYSAGASSVGGEPNEWWPIESLGPVWVIAPSYEVESTTGEFVPDAAEDLTNPDHALDACDAYAYILAETDASGRPTFPLPPSCQPTFSPSRMEPSQI